MRFHSSRRVHSIALSLLVAALTPLGCTAESAPPEEPISQARQTLLAQGLLVASNEGLWHRDAIGPGTGNAWSHVGAAHGVTGMAFHQGDLYVASADKLWKRGPVGEWTDVGEAHGVTSMASFGGKLYMTSNNALWKRGAIGPGTGNDWINVGEAYGVTAMAANTFSDTPPKTSFHWGNGATNVFTGDFDGDGKWDIGVTGTATQGDRDWYILYGDGQGNFGRPTTYHWGNGVTNVFTGDFDGNGKWDIGVTGTATQGDRNWYFGYGDGQGQFVVDPRRLGDARCNDQVRLKSWKGDYLHRPDSPQGVTTGTSGIGNVWTVECRSDGGIQLQSWKGDYLHRPDSPQGVTTGTGGIGNAWTAIPTPDGRVELRLWKGDYLHRPDSPQGVATWNQGEWTAEVVVLGSAACNEQVRLRSWKGDYLSRTDIDDDEPRVSTAAAGRNEVWTVDCATDGKIQLRSWKGDYLHRPDIPRGVTTWSFGEWDVEGTGDTVSLRSSKGDYLHRPDIAQGVTTWDQGQWTVEPLPSASLAAKFAPRLRFDGAAPNYPTSAEAFIWQTVQLGRDVIDNTDYSVIASNKIPTYYQVTTCGKQVRIMYWWFYGYQHPCFGAEGGHNGDWENVMVTLSEDQSRVAAVTFYAHGDRYTRLAARDGFRTEDGTHPVVYVGKLAHGAYYNQGGSGTCGFWEDYRNNFDESHMDSWNNLVNLDGDAEAWLAFDRTSDFTWGEDGVSTHPTLSGPTCEMNACDWSTWGAAGAIGHSQCKLGDDDTGVECIDECRSGYTNVGLTCTKCSGDWWNPLDWYCDTYSRYRYSYDYDIPTSDSGLLYSDG